MALPETNLTLIARMKDPVDQRAWQEFVGAYEPFLLRMLIRRGLMDADARDVVQQIFLAVCRSLNQWNPDGIDGSFRRWLSGVTRHTVLKFLRTKNRQPMNIGGSDFLNQQLELPDNDVDGTKLQQEYDRKFFLVCR
jgi:RNA polymerase sigma-70 factor, ECF subfamily